MVMEKNTASSINAELEIVHAVRGRMRLRLKGDDARELLPSIAHHLRKQVGIHTVQTKPTSNSLVVTYDSGAISVEQLTDSLHSFGSIAIPTEAISRSTGESHTLTYSRLFSLVPPLVGLGIARGLGVSGWKSILTYILAAGLTREVIDQVTGEPEKIELSPVRQVLRSEIVAEEVLTLLTVIDTDYEIVHHVPGRIRLRVPRISRDRTYGQELKHLLEQDTRIIKLRLKTNSSSLVIFYDPGVLADSNVETAILDDGKGKTVVQPVEESDNSTIPNQKTKDRQPTIKSDLNNTASPETETSSEPKSSTSETETGTSDADTSKATPIADDESESSTHQEFTTPRIITKSDYWSNFKSSILLTMLQLMGNRQVQTAEI